MLQGSAAPAAAFFGGSVEDLAELIKDTRNFYTHYDPKERTKAVHEIALDDLADRMWFIVRSCVLSEMRLSTGEITAALARDPVANRQQRSLPAPGSRT